MDIEDLEKLWARFKKRPRTVATSVIVFSILAAAGIFASTYLSECARLTLQGKTPTPAVSQPQTGENQYVRISKVASVGTGRFALIIEFGVRYQPTDGFNGGIDVGTPTQRCNPGSGPLSVRTLSLAAWF